MSILIILTIAVLSVLIGRHIFGKWFNHITVYVFMWTAMLVLYELKLMRYLDIKPLAWWGIAGAYFSFFLGSILVHVARSAVGNRTHQIDHHKRDLQIFSDDGKTINLIILVCSLIGLFAAIQHWVVLIKMFGSIPAVLVKVNLIYKMRVDGEIKGVLPYAFIFSYMGVFFSSLLIAYKNRLTLLSILPFIAVFLKEIANAGRGGMLYALFLFITTFFTYKQFIAKKERSNIKKSKASIIISAIVLIGLFISAATYVKSLRGTIENFSASSKQLNKLNTGAVISPSIYLYASAHVGVYSQFLYMDYDYRAMPGETTFQPVYNFLSKFGFVKHPRFYESGYYIPMWTNTATYLRTIHEDFGPVGNFVFPFILGLLASYFWYRFYENGKLLDLVLLAHVYLIVFFSFLVMVTRYGMWFISLAALLLLLPLIEKYISYKKRSQDGAKVLPDQPR